jgi:hypothetical protein
MYNNSSGENICKWLINKLDEKMISELWIVDENKSSKYIDIIWLSNIVPFIISTFQIISDIIKDKYYLSPNLNFDIRDWYVIKYERDTDKIPSFLENKEHDLSIQIVISEYDNIYNNKPNGNIYVGKNMKYYPKSNYIFIFLINFSFIYMNKNDEKINICLKDLAYDILSDMKK